MNENFQELKDEILSRAKSVMACKEQYGRAYRAESLEELMQVVKDNFLWACNHKIITLKLIEQYRKAFASCDIRANEDVSSGYLLCVNSSVVARNNAYVVAYGSASVDAWNYVSVHAFEKVSVNAWDYTSVIANDYVTVNGFDYASVIAMGNAFVEAFDNSSVVADGTPSVCGWNFAVVSSWRKLKNVVLRNCAIYQVESEDTIYYSSDDIKFVKQL